MPLPSEQLWEAIAETSFTKCLEIIQKNPEVLSTLNVDENTPLIEILMIGEIADYRTEDFFKLIRFLARQGNLNLSYKNPLSDQTAIDSICSARDPEILKVFINHPDIIYNGEQFSYVLATNKLRIDEKDYENYKQTQPNSSQTLIAKQDVENSKLIQELILQATLCFLPLHPKFNTTPFSAILATKNPQILQLFLSRPGIIYTGDELNCIMVSDQHLAALGAYLAAAKTTPNAPATLQLKQDVDNLAMMLKMMERASTVQALEEDNAVLIEKLSKAKCLYIGFLNDKYENYLSLAIKLGKKNIVDWADRGHKQSAAALVSSGDSLLQSAKQTRTGQQQVAQGQQAAIQTHANTANEIRLRVRQSEAQLLETVVQEFGGMAMR